MFANYDTEKKGYLELEQFLAFYEKAAQKNLTTVWSNLTWSGYGPDLNRLDATKKIITSSSAMCERLPRYILTNHKESFDVLISLLSTCIISNE